MLCCLKEEYYFRISFIALKPMYSFGKSVKMLDKFHLMGFVSMSCKSPVNLFQCETIHFLRKLHKTITFSGCPRKILPYSYVHMLPQSGHISYELIVPFQIDSKEV